MSISQFFFRDSYFTKKHNENDRNNNHHHIEKEMNLFTPKNNSDNKSIKTKNSHSSNNSNNSNINIDEEAELYFAEVETIIPIDEKYNNIAIYNIKIKSSLNFNDSWIKPCSLDDLIKFRDYLLKYTYSVINLPFPQKSWFRFLPYIGHKYDERNWDILLENKFLLDDFFKTICKDKEMYKLSGFINFFSKPATSRNTNNSFYN